jgi:hypothetical protein
MRSFVSRVWFVLGMGVPTFEHGYLPRGAQQGFVSLPGEAGVVFDTPTYCGHPCTEVEIRDRLVAPFTDSISRATLFENAWQMVRQVELRVPCSLYLLSGPFVVDEPNPQEIHLIALVSADQANGLEGPEKWLLEFLMDGRDFVVGEDLRVLTEMAYVYPLGHARWDDCLVRIAGIRHTCGYPSLDDREAGYLQFTLCEGGDYRDEIRDLLTSAA